MRNLRIARLIGPYQADAGAARQRGLAIKKKEECKCKKYSRLAYGSPMGQMYASALRRIRSGWFQMGFHFQCFSNGDLACLAQTSDSASGQNNWGELTGFGLASALPGNAEIVLRIGRLKANRFGPSGGISIDGSPLARKLGGRLLGSRLLPLAVPVHQLVNPSLKPP